MLKFRLYALIVLLVFATSCAKKVVINGFVGKPVTITPQLKAPEDSVDCLFKWSFVTKPAESNMDVLSFQPDSRSFEVTFVPDVVGEYLVEFTMTTTEGKEQLKQSYTCQISEDTSQTAVAPPPPIIIPTTPKQEVPGPSISSTTTYQPSKDVKPKPKPRTIKSAQKIPKMEGKYTIQVSAWKNIAQAEAAKNRLEAVSIDAYIQKAYFPETKMTWYRVRTGSFDSYAEAQAALKDLKTKFPKENFWIDFARQD